MVSDFESTVIRFMTDGEVHFASAMALQSDAPIDGVACRGARAMLGLSQVDLSKFSQCSRQTINDFENGVRVPRDRNVARIREALEEMGAVFLDCGGSVAVRVDPGLASARTPRARTMGGG